MKDILKQIQQLQEDFMNLIEVEGLGEPASDVPPSTNKIKKDVKTKNGKVELVSVEDELFPKDGNAREQFRQKVIDIINGMIQGTATLEDLMQVVRQKKMPVKENLENQVEKKFKKGDINLDKAFDLIKKIESKMSSEKNNQERNDKIEKDAMKMSPSMERASYLRQIGKAIRRNQRKNALAFESLEEALALMEDLADQILKQPIEDRGILLYKYHQMKNKEHAGKDSYSRVKEIRKQESKEEKGQRKTEHRKKYRGKSVEDWKIGRLLDQVAKNAANLGKNNDPATAKAIRRHSSKIGEALSIMEEFINELKSDTVKNALDKRTDQSIEADEKDRKEFNDILNIEDRDKRAKAYREFKDKSDKRFDKENKKLDLYAKYAKKYPELVEAFNLIQELFDGPDLIDDDIVGQKGFTKKMIRKGTVGAIKAIGHGIQKAIDKK